MASFPTRRSPRLIENLCNRIVFSPLDYEQTATVLSLAHCTGWAADQITNKVAGTFGVLIPVEILWEKHYGWVVGRDFKDLSTSEWEIMQVLMRRVGVVMAEAGRALSETPPPKTIWFAEQWSAKNEHGRPVFAGFTDNAREASKAYLLAQNNQGCLGRLTPVEELIFCSFGENILWVLKRVLAAWAVAMWARIHERPGLRPIQSREHVELIMDHLMLFQKSYEEIFGKMESGKPMSAFGEIQDNTVFIKSTGYGVKVILGLLMADRMHVVERKRRLEQEAIGFVELEAEDVEHDAKDCPICQDPIGIECPEGTKETPLRLVICCGQLIGSECLRMWLSELVYQEKHRDTCPVCRFQFPVTFLQKLFSKGEYEARAAHERSMGDLPGPSPEPVEHSSQPVEPMRAQQEQGTFQAAIDGGGELYDESDLMDVDSGSDMELVSPLVLSGARRVMRYMAMGFIEDISLPEVEHGELTEDKVIEANLDIEG